MRTNNKCPTGPEFQALGNHPEFGKFEAMRDWMEHDGEVRTVKQVLQKLATKRGSEEKYVPSQPAAETSITDVSVGQVLPIRVDVESTEYTRNDLRIL